MTTARRSESAEVIRAVAHRWFDQVLATCDPLYTAHVHNEHRALCAALDRLTPVGLSTSQRATDRRGHGASEGDPSL